MADQKDKNSKQNIIGSALSALVVFLKSSVLSMLIGVLNTPGLLLKTIKGALDGLSKGGLTGLLGDLAKSA